MNRRSAIAVAGGLTGALVSGVAGYSVRVHQPLSSAAEPTGKPIVKTQVRTITIHKKAKPAAGAAIAQAPVQTVVVHRAPTVVHLPTAPAPPPATHHTGGSGHAPGGDDGDRGEHEGGGGDD